jgi:hypothetical protein
MAGINTAPSQGFWGRMGQNLPGALNMAGSMMPGPFGQTARIAGALTRKPRQAAATNPDVQGKQTTMQNGPSGMPPTGPGTTSGSAGMVMPTEEGIVRGPSMPRIIGPGMGMPFQGGGFMPPGRNTGITGGMFGGMRPQVEPQMAMGNDIGMPGGGMPGGGLWQAYNQLSQGAPRRPQMFY